MHHPGGSPPGFARHQGPAQKREGGEVYLLCAPHLEGFYRRFGFQPLDLRAMPFVLEIKYILCRLGLVSGRVIAMKRFGRKELQGNEGFDP